ncbi:hypothetical protein ACN4EK_13155 [Pantanalinema rosaneae CENA516]|uniref:hypothetical protein n=1 Tax=Pantanalinema rosaneae TaxID=1620701 RepID=UPI003D6EA999
MNQRLPIYSQRTFLREAMVALARADTETAGSCQLLEDCLLALAVEEMCAIVQVQGSVGYRLQSSVLDQALAAIERSVVQASSESWCPDWWQVRELLKQPASQLEELQARLIHPIERQARPERERVEGEQAVPFDLLHLPKLGLLVAVPAQERYYLDLARVQAQENWVVSGEYYPFEIQAAGWTFVVSAAGEAIVWVQNFPDSLIQQAREMLKEVAQTLYSQGRPHFRARGEAPDDPERSERSGEEE